MARALCPEPHSLGPRGPTQGAFSRTPGSSKKQQPGACGREDCRGRAAVETPTGPAASDSDPKDPGALLKDPGVL